MQGQRRPLIGLIGGNYESKYGSLVYGMLASYFKALSGAGALPVLIAPNVDGDALRMLYERCDGLLLAGGPDINPALYKMDATHVKMHAVNDARDAAEVRYVQWAVAEDKPVLAICRGHQVANVALGGTLYRDIAAEYPGFNGLIHDVSTDDARTRLAHHVEVDPGSRLAQILGAYTVKVNSLHHQALREVAPQLRVTAHATDDHLIEAAEIPDARFFVSVQWHPEELVESSGAMRNLFSAFVSASC
jgi:putative glutamine amidotransferase